MNRNLKSGVALLSLALITVGCVNDTTEINEENNLDFTVEQSSDGFLNEEVGSYENIPGQYIVVYNTDFGKSMSVENSKQAVLNLTQDILGTANRNAQELEISNIYSKALNGVSIKLSESQIALLNADERVKFIEQDRIVQFAPPCGTPNGGPCDGDGDNGDGGGSSAQETPWGITRVNGGGTYTGNSVAWILDSGVDLTHQDLNVDASRGYNAFTSGPDGKSADDLNGHGSHVAGTIAAIDNTIGVIGVAPGATVIPVKVLDRRGSGPYSGVIAGVDHVAANGSPGDVANMSLGGPVSVALENAISNAAQGGVKFFLAAGNESQDANNVSPARLNGNNIYTISAMSQGDNWASYSNFGNPPVDYCAPGSAVKSTWKGGGYNTISGTSMATPHAAGVALLGNISTSGTVNGDPDGNADAIITH